MIIKYIVMPEFNCSDEDFQEQIDILKELKLDRILLSQDALHGKSLFVQRMMDGGSEI